MLYYLKLPTYHRELTVGTHSFHRKYSGIKNNVINYSSKLNKRSRIKTVKNVTFFFYYLAHADYP